MRPRPISASRIAWPLFVLTSCSCLEACIRLPDYCGAPPHVCPYFFSVKYSFHSDGVRLRFAISHARRVHQDSSRCHVRTVPSLLDDATSADAPTNAACQTILV